MFGMIFTNSASSFLQFFCSCCSSLVGLSRNCHQGLLSEETWTCYWLVTLEPANLSCSNMCTKLHLEASTPVGGEAQL
jgi:hypothetical protein